MSSQPPTNTGSPRRSNGPWRLRGVSQAEPHLGEGKGIPLIVWIILGGVFLVLVILGVVFLLQTGKQTPVPTSLPTATALPPTPTLLPPTSSLTPTEATTTSPPTATRTLTPTATATVPPPTASFVKYRVRVGDTLTAIAARYRVSIQSIMLANKLRNDFIYDGQELIIPLPTPHP